MRTSAHLIFSMILAIALYTIFGHGVILIIAGGVLIDVDHYIWYATKYNDLDIKRCYKHYEESLETNDFGKHFGILLIFHNLEFLIAMFTLSFYSKYALIILIGVLGHYILDMIFFYKASKRFISNPSFFFWIWKNKFKNFK